MTRHVLRAGLALILLGCLAARDARAQGPTIDSTLPTSPGSGESMLGAAPGSGGGLFTEAGGSAPLLSGRPGATAPHVPQSVTSPDLAPSPTRLQVGITAPKP